MVIAESFERIHRSNLIGMGILPLQFIDNMDRIKLKMKGSELITIINIERGINPSSSVDVEIKYDSGDNGAVLFIQKLYLLKSFYRN